MNVSYREKKDGKKIKKKTKKWENLKPEILRWKLLHKNLYDEKSTRNKVFVR